MSELKNTAIVKWMHNASVVDAHMYLAGRAEKRMNQRYHRSTVR